jgi:hypothetical protein
LSDTKVTLIGRGGFPLKIQDGSYSFDITESEYDNQIALSPTNVRGRNSKTMFVIKKSNLLFLIATYTVK